MSRRPSWLLGEVSLSGGALEGDREGGPVRAEECGAHFPAFAGVLDAADVAGGDVDQGEVGEAFGARRDAVECGRDGGAVGAEYGGGEEELVGEMGDAAEFLRGHRVYSDGTGFVGVLSGGWRADRRGGCANRIVTYNARALVPGFLRRLLARFTSRFALALIDELEVLGLSRAKVMVPEANRVAGMQNAGDFAVFALFAQIRVFFLIRRAGEHLGGNDRHVGILGAGDRAESAEPG